MTKAERRWSTACLLAAGALGCRERSGAPAAARSTPSAVAPSAPASAPADRLAPGEAAPGQQVVHGLALPRGTVLERQFGATVHAIVPSGPEVAANWIRSHAEDADGVVGPRGTVFAVVHPKGASRDHHLRIEVGPGPRPESAAVVIDRVDDTRPLVPEGATNDELLKKAGLAPNGQFLDPLHLE